jgi:hypothetical protein
VAGHSGFCRSDPQFGFVLRIMRFSDRKTRYRFRLCIGASRSLALFPGLAGRDPSQAAHAESVAILRKIRAGAGKRSLARRL